MSHVRALKGLYGFSRHRTAPLLKQPFMALVDHVRAPYGAKKSLRAPYEQLRLVRSVYMRVFTSPLSISKGPYLAHTAPYGTRREDVLILTIPINTETPQNARMHVTMNIEESCFHTDFPRVIRPYGSPSYGSGPFICITRCCGHMHTSVLWVICVFCGHGVARYRTCTLHVP